MTLGALRYGMQSDNATPAVLIRLFMSCRFVLVLSAEQIHAILDMSEEDAECLLFAVSCFVKVVRDFAYTSAVSTTLIQTN